MYQEDDKTFQTSYGRQTASGKYQTIKQIRQGSFGSNLLNSCKMTILILMLLSCIWCIYTIDYKEESKNVADAAKKVANVSLDDIYDETVQAGHKIKQGVQKKIDAAEQKISDLDQKYKITDKIKENYDSLKNKIHELISSDQGEQSSAEAKRRQKQEQPLLQRLKDEVKDKAAEIKDKAAEVKKQAVNAMYPQDEI